MKNKEKKTNIRPFTRQFYRQNRWRILLMLLQTVVITAGNLLIAWLLQQILDLVSGVNTGYTFSQMALTAGICIGIMVVSFALAYMARPGFIAQAMRQYQEYVFSQISQKGIAAFSGENTSLYVSALSNDAATIESHYLMNIFQILFQTVRGIAALGMMLWYSPLLTAVSIGLSLFPVLASLAAGSRAETAEKKVSDCNESYMSTLRDSLAGFSVVKSFRAEKQMCRIFAEKAGEAAKAKKQRQKISIFIQMLSSIAGVVVQLGVFLVGAFLAISGRGITAGTVIVFVQLLNFVLEPIGTIPNYLAELKAARALIRKLAAALARNVHELGTCEKRTLQRGITLQNLSFAYEADQPILQDVSFTFEAGRSYAVVGASGSGKSTLLNLLMAAYHGYTGAISYDETELRDISGESLYDMVSVIQQNVFIFNASIRDNITMFSEFPEEEVDRAIWLSGLSDLVEKKGQDYLCGENGNGLSGGEKQRISIARSLLRHSQVLLADEATAALDASTASQVSGAILDLKELTRIVVTHSLEASLLQQYDCIVALKNGQIIESGSFRELMVRKGYFYSLYTVSQ